MRFHNGLSNKFVSKTNWTPAYASVMDGGRHCGMLKAAIQSIEKIYQKIFLTEQYTLLTVVAEKKGYALKPRLKGSIEWRA